MILHQQPKTFVITLKDHEISLKQQNDCFESAAKHYWNVEIFWGVNGRNLTEKDWEEIQVKPITDRPGQRGCWFSHFLLWKKCLELDEPIIVLEHDAIIQKKWSPLEIGDSLVKLHRHYRKDPMSHKWNHPVTGRWSPSTHAYCLTPEHATILIQAAKSIGCYNADVFMGDKIISVKLLGDPELVSRQNSFSTTGTI
jgi:GR25 family glycosyltransferase involved in LPS biosynthesis